MLPVPVTLPPALRKMDGFTKGFDIGEDRELAPNPKELYARLSRVRVEWLREPVADAAIAERFAEQPQMLCARRGAPGSRSRPGGASRRSGVRRP